MIATLDKTFQSTTGQRRHKAPTSLTVADVEKMNIDRPFELIDGRIVEKMPNGMHGKMQAEMIFRIRFYLESNPIGSVFGEVNYQLDPDNLRESKAPDLSFVRAEKVPAELDKFLRMAPDLAVEVVSPTDLADDLFDKAAYYLDHGVEEVWLVYARAKKVVIYRKDGIYGAAETLTSKLLPGFELNLKTLFAEAGR